MAFPTDASRGRCSSTPVLFCTKCISWWIQSISESVKRTMSPALSPKLAATANIAVSRSDRVGFFAAVSMTIRTSFEEKAGRSFFLGAGRVINALKSRQLFVDTRYALRCFNVLPTLSMLDFRWDAMNTKKALTFPKFISWQVWQSLSSRYAKNLRQIFSSPRRLSNPMARVFASCWQKLHRSSW